MRPVLLVIGQFTCIALLLFGGGSDLPALAWGLFGIGILIFLWAAASLGASNFTVMPDPRAGGAFTQRGIYRFVRHPMYTAVLVCGLAMTLGSPTMLRIIALAACAMILVLKIGYEERQLSARYPEYPAKMKGVARLLPFIW